MCVTLTSLPHHLIALAAARDANTYTRATQDNHGTAPHTLPHAPPNAGSGLACACACVCARGCEGREQSPPPRTPATASLTLTSPRRATNPPATPLPPSRSVLLSSLSLPLPSSSSTLLPARLLPVTFSICALKSRSASLCNRSGLPQSFPICCKALRAVTVRFPQTRDAVNPTSAAYRTQDAVWRGDKVRVSGDVSCHIQ
ncbi:hypothetical protein E2C01_025612 [Portunus trituberculatus]|uniref:Uncharacterized protein n=1 Tax=Portunus trituberculatus TaxID=210409 RepID=A0A5B7EDT6_PORTR|nr:hypothetical protein [Portunus trituberculatus]